MEDILNKWTTELNRYHTEFQRVAVDVGKWDQMIIQNGAQVSYIYIFVIQIKKIFYISNIYL